ncbi:hypothetical protein DFH94DRAFT_841529 [Russula ochroleuca]|uniref:Fungal STAND N-terminal Goodbye domain-containing protein n=1 Tax=Russula ochroleuca TaxID=152965 RepID=A0A9P5TEG7_9AGAM|nr:hypothetical protein DFH94DRAFT_841529 [Russula ochroleuca]
MCSQSEISEFDTAFLISGLLQNVNNTISTQHFDFTGVIPRLSNCSASKLQERDGPDPGPAITRARAPTYRWPLHIPSASIMSVVAVASTSTPHSNFVSIFNAALETYRRKTKKDLTTHPLLLSLQSCDSPEAILTVLRDQIPAFSQSQNGDDGLTKWVAPTVTVLYAFSATLGGGVGLVFPPANAIFAGIGVLLLAAKDASASQEKLIELFNRIERFFQRLEIYIGITPTTAMTDIIIEIMVEVLTILAIATKEVKRGRLKKYIKKLTGNKDIEDSLDRLDKLTAEEMRMASAELLKVTHSVEGNVQDVRNNVQYVGNKVQGVDDRVQGVGSDVKDMSSDVKDISRVIDDKFGQVNRSLSL